jgi:uncharacterized membrane protein
MLGVKFMNGKTINLIILILALVAGMTTGCKKKSETAAQVTQKAKYNTMAIINVDYPAVFDRSCFVMGKV